MADDDEFERLCKSFEDETGPEVTTAVVDNKDTSDIIDEIDSFLEEDDNDNCVINKEYHSKSRIVSSFRNNTSSKLETHNAPLIPPPVHSLPKAAIRSPAVAFAHPPSPTDPLAKHWSEIAPTLANLPEDQARPVEQDVANSDGLDLSLLDKEEWEDDWEMREFTMSDILNELKEHLLDEVDEEEGSVVDEVNSCEEEISASKEEKNAEFSSQKKNEFENLESRSRVTEERYYQQLEDVWKRYAGQVGVGQMPHRKMMVRPRIFKHNGVIVGYETLQEYVDNNHPLWGPHRQIFKEVLFKERVQGDLVRFVAKQWGDQQVNTARNLTVFSRGGRGSFAGRKERNVVKVQKVGEVTGEEGKLSIKEAKATLVDMYANSSNVDGVKETEEARWKLFEAALKTKLQEAEALKSGVEELEECDLCGPVCVCMVGRKRKAGREGGGMVSKQQYFDCVLSSARREEWSVDRTAEVMFGVEESFELQACYNNNPYFSREQVSELTSVEEVHGMITKMYDSPYKKDNQDDTNTGTWSKQLLEDY